MFDCLFLVIDKEKFDGFHSEDNNRIFSIQDVEMDYYPLRFCRVTIPIWKFVLRTFFSIDSSVRLLWGSKTL